MQNKWENNQGMCFRLPNHKSSVTENPPSVKSSHLSSQNEDVPAIPVSGEMSHPGVAFLWTQFKEAPSNSSQSQRPVSFSSEQAVPTER